MTVIHARSVRLFVNAGMAFPVCYSRAKSLDLDKARLRTNGPTELVTCKHCLRMLRQDGAA